jgi:serine/threonine protein kinase
LESTPVFPEGLEMIRPLGDGKMARVFLARETDLQRVVAVKVLRAELSADETARARFEREARSAASLTHPAVVSVHRFGRLADGTPYLVMTFVNGRTLADRLKAEGVMQEAEARALLVQIASALAAAHKKGIVHRDVRPANVLVDEETGRYMLADFGIAGLLEGGGESGPRLTRTGQIIGEPRYASPEQLRGEKVTGQADLYSLAVLAYEVLTGESPYAVSSTRETITAHLAGEPRPISRIRPGVSSDLEDLLLRCLARQPTHRPRAEDVVKRLEAWGTADGASSGLAETGDLLLMKKRVPQIVLSTLAAGVTLVGLVGTLEQMNRLPTGAFDHAINLSIFSLFASFVIAWFHGEKGDQVSPLLERWILGVIGAGWLGVTVLLLLRP